MKRSVIISGALITLMGLAAFGLVDGITSDERGGGVSSLNAGNKALSDLGINGGIKVNYYTGQVSSFVAAKADLFYLVRGKYGRSMFTEQYRHAITLEQLQKATSVADLISNYPDTWIASYQSVELLTVSHGEEVKAVGSDKTLTPEQKALFSSEEPPQFVNVTVKYQCINGVTNQLENREMNVSLEVQPDQPAAFEGGYDQLISYLKENSMEQMLDKNFPRLPQPSISFVINEQGEVDQVQLTASSGDKEIDQLLVKVVTEMPKWKPAKNAQDLPVKQAFVLEIGRDGC